MSHHSPQSSAGMGPSSSPFAGTDPTLYSPELSRNSHSGHRRQNFSQITVVAAGKQSLRNADKVNDNYKTILPVAVAYLQGAFINEMSENDNNYISRFQFISRLPDGTTAGMDSEHELFTVQHQMKLVSDPVLPRIALCLTSTSMLALETVFLSTPVVFIFALTISTTLPKPRTFLSSTISLSATFLDTSSLLPSLRILPSSMNSRVRSSSPS